MPQKHGEEPGKLMREDAFLRFSSLIALTLLREAQAFPLACSLRSLKACLHANTLRQGQDRERKHQLSAVSSQHEPLCVS